MIGGLDVSDYAKRAREAQAKSQRPKESPTDKWGTNPIRQTARICQYCRNDVVRCVCPK